MKFLSFMKGCLFFDIKHNAEHMKDYKPNKNTKFVTIINRRLVVAPNKRSDHSVSKTKIPIANLHALIEVKSNLKFSYQFI